MSTPTLTPEQEYLGSIRRSRLGYAIAIAVGVVVIAVGSAVFLQRGEVSHVTLRTFAEPPDAVPVLTPDAALKQVWTSTDASAIGQPYWGGTIVTHDEHTVRGRDPRSGSETWSYTRSDRTVCTAAQLRGVTIAVYRDKGNCDQLTGLDTQTGERKWTRTADKDGLPVNGTPRFQATGYTLMLTTASVIYAIDPVTGLDRWQFGQSGCTIQDAVLGSTGALIRQNCTDPDCPAPTATSSSAPAGTPAADGPPPVVCGPGQQLLLRDPNTGRSDDGDNRDQVTWDLVGSDLLPVSADQQVLAADKATGALVVLDSETGAEGKRLPLEQGVGDVIMHTDAGDGELVWTNGQTYAVRSSALLWDRATPTVPTVSAREGEAADLSTGIVLVPGSGAAELIAPGKGSVTTVAGPSFTDPEQLAYAFGAGVLAAGTTTALYQ